MFPTFSDSYSKSYFFLTAFLLLSPILAMAHTPIEQSEAELATSQINDVLKIVETRYSKNTKIHEHLSSLLSSIIEKEDLAQSKTADSKAKNGNITFQNIARENPDLAFSRVRSDDFVFVQETAERSLESPVTFFDLIHTPESTGGFPGVAVFDYDNDGDLDLYVTNGPRAANSLFQNQLAQNGALSFIDVAATAGVTATAQDSAGVSFGDLDNDGDHDLLIIGRGEANILFENKGDGTFQEVENSGLDGRFIWSVSSTLGDINGDGLLDVFIANNSFQSDSRWIYLEPFLLNEFNELYINNGDLTFRDVSESSGIWDIKGISGEMQPTVTWAAAMIDIDLDGDIDIVQADDQAGVPSAASGGADRGIIHILLNDGNGFFRDQPIEGKIGNWMGLSFGDLDRNGTIDIFGSNFGDYANGAFEAPESPFLASRWFLGEGDGTFKDPGIGDLLATPFCWGTAMIDYDNDTDLDIIAYGGLDSYYLISDNPGAIYQNDGSANFTYDQGAIAYDSFCTEQLGERVVHCTEHIGRNVRGLAVGDLDRNGFYDVISVASVKRNPNQTLKKGPDQFGSMLDSTALFSYTMEPDEDGNYVWGGYYPDNGNLSVEMNSGNENQWVSVTAKGSIGLTTTGKVNRDGIGATITFYPINSEPVMVPVTGGSSHVSQHSLEKIFGLGTSHWGIVDVQWPGGNQNRLFGVRNGERIVMPEISCSRDEDLNTYLACYSSTLDELRSADVIDRRMWRRLYVSGLIFYFQR